MAQPAGHNFSFTLPSQAVHLVWPVMAYLAITRITSLSHFDQVLAIRVEKLSNRLERIVDLHLYNAAVGAIKDFPVIALSAGITYAVQAYNLTSLSTMTGAPGALKVAIFVGGVFALRAASASYLMGLWPPAVKLPEKAVSEERESLIVRTTDTLPAVDSRAEKIRKTAVFHLLPVAVGSAAAYYTNFPVKIMQAALYTASLMGAIRLMGRGFEYLLSTERVQSLVDRLYGAPRSRGYERL